MKDKKHIYLFIESYSKSVFKCLLTFHDKFDDKKLKMVIFELGNLLWNMFWIFIANSSSVVSNMEYVSNVYIEKILLILNDNSDVLNNIEKEAKIFCYRLALEKFKHTPKSLCYNPVECNIFFIVKTRIDLYVFHNSNTIIKSTNYFESFLKLLHCKYSKCDLNPFLLELELNNLLGLVQEELNSYEN